MGQSYGRQVGGMARQTNTSVARINAALARIQRYPLLCRRPPRAVAMSRFSCIPKCPGLSAPGAKRGSDRSTRQ